MDHQRATAHFADKLGPNQPPRRETVPDVDFDQEAPKTTGELMEMVRDMVQREVGFLHRKSKRERSLGSEDLDTVGKLALILQRIDKQVPVDPTKLSDADLAKAAR